MRHTSFSCIVFIHLFATGVSAQAALIATDTPNDAGNSITLTLPKARTNDTWYRVSYSETTSGTFELLQELAGDPAAKKPQTIRVTSLPLPDGSAQPIENGKTIFFKVIYDSLYQWLFRSDNSESYACY